MIDLGCVSTNGLTLLAALLVAVAPVQAVPQEISPEDRAAIEVGPVFTSMTARPQIQNPTEVLAAVMKAYPAELRDSGLGGTAWVWFYVSETGQNLHNQIARGSGREQLDQAALAAAAAYRFTPAIDRRQIKPSTPLSHPLIRTQERLVAAWIQLPITFALGEDHAAILGGPVFTPMTVRPELMNRNEVIAAMMREYPSELRDSGLGGRAMVWFYISEEGQVLATIIAESSGYEELDQAAARIAAVYEFTPARNGTDPVPVWIQLPITFTAP